MKTKDRLKEEIGFEKLLMTILSAIASPLFAWLFNQYNQISLAAAIMVTLFALSLVSIITFLFANINTKIKELDYD